MPDTVTQKLIEDKVAIIEAHGFGEVIIKVRNGTVYRILQIEDTVIEPDSNQTLDKSKD